MKIEGIIWFDYIIEKLFIKHNVLPNEVKEILCNKPHFRFVEKGYKYGENVYSAMGSTDNKRNLIVFFIYKKSKHALILSARDMTKSERKLYEKI